MNKEYYIEIPDDQSRKIYDLIKICMKNFESIKKEYGDNRTDILIEIIKMSNLIISKSHKMEYSLLPGLNYAQFLCEDLYITFEENIYKEIKNNILYIISFLKKIEY